MAKKKQTQIIELDVITKGLETTEKNFQKLIGNTGDMGKKAKSVLEDIGNIRDLIDEFGEEIPITQAKELQKLFESTIAESMHRKKITHYWYAVRNFTFLPTKQLNKSTFVRIFAYLCKKFQPEKKLSTYTNSSL